VKRGAPQRPAIHRHFAGAERKVRQHLQGLLQPEILRILRVLRQVEPGLVDRVGQGADRGRGVIIIDAKQFVLLQFGNRLYPVDFGRNFRDGREMPVLDLQANPHEPAINKNGVTRLHQMLKKTDPVHS